MPEHSASRAAIYASAGRHLFCFAVDEGGAGLRRQVIARASLGSGTAMAESIEFPANVQYAVPAPARRILYVAASDGVDANRHILAAFRIDARTGALTEIGGRVDLPHRPIHIDLHPSGRFLLVASNKPRTITVYRLEADGRLGALVPQTPPADGGFFVHQVRVHADGNTVIAPALGWHKTDTAVEQLGQITTFDFDDGLLTRASNVVPGPGFGPRHADFHPTLPLVYVAVERGNLLNVYRLEDGKLPAQPRYSLTTLREPGNLRGSQRVGAIHVHPNGRFVYLTNRNDAVGPHGCFLGGENSVAVFALDPETGAPAPVQHEDTRGLEPRTFTITPAHDFLIVANQKAMKCAGGGIVRPNLALFGLAADGRVSFAGTTDLPREGDAMWVGAVALSGAERA